ncbi:MAG: ABC transporter ATP-binding protein [Prevotella sp.]|nr:ABC transporter ATP-binding protein [Prevotella sp.]
MQIDINHLVKTFGEKTAVDISSFQINHGDILGLVGNNGAGKTTLFRLMLDLLRADEGEVIMTPHVTAEGLEVEPINPAQSEKWKKMTGAYIDDGFLIDFLSPEEYLDFIAKINGQSPINWDQIEESAVARFLPFANGEIFGQKKYIRDFSAGNKQKIGIISVLFSQPELVILDEPFNFLDPSGQNILKHILTDYHQSTGATILVSSHNLQHTVDISTRIALLEKGKIIEDMPNDQGSARLTLEEYFRV